MKFFPNPQTAFFLPMMAETRFCVIFSLSALCFLVPEPLESPQKP